jgi:hypothetical protein
MKITMLGKDPPPNLVEGWTSLATLPPSTDNDTPSLNKEAIDYYKTRLGHTLDHTQKMPQLAYVVNGGILAAFYFLTGKDATWLTKTHVGIYLLIVLSGINLVQIALLIVQGRWYYVLDERYLASVGINPKDKPRSGIWPGTTLLHIMLHIGLFLAILGAMIYLLFYPIPNHLRQTKSPPLLAGLVKRFSRLQSVALISDVGKQLRTCILDEQR